MGEMWMIARQLLLMFFYMGIGSFLYRKKLISDEGGRGLGNLVLYVLLPAVILHSFCAEKEAAEIRFFLLSLLAGMAALLLSMTVSALLFRKRPLDQFGAAFSCAGFMGIPLIVVIAGQRGVLYAAGMVALLNILQWFYGQRLLMEQRAPFRPEELIKNPLVLSCLLGLFLFLGKWDLPLLLTDAIGTLAGANTPAAMIVLGVYLGQADLRQFVRGRAAYEVSLVRLLLIPLATFFLLALLPFLPFELRISIFTAASAPVGSNVAIYAQRQNRDYVYAVKLVCLSTLLSILTMPALLYLASWWFRR